MIRHCQHYPDRPAHRRTGNYRAGTGKRYQDHRRNGERSEKIHADSAQLFQKIPGALKLRLKGALKLGVIYTIGPFLLPHLIPLLNREAPELTLIIEESFTPESRRAA